MTLALNLAKASLELKSNAGDFLAKLNYKKILSRKLNLKYTFSITQRTTKKKIHRDVKNLELNAL